jgi:hypothetical protein
MAAIAMALTLLALLALAGWQGTLSRQSRGAHLSVLLVVAVTVAVAVLVGRGRQRMDATAWVRFTHDRWQSSDSVYRLGMVIWAVLLGSVVGWDLNSFVHQSHDLPTLSHYVGLVTRYDGGRAVLFAVWLAAGAFLAVARRVARRN